MKITRQNEERVMKDLAEHLAASTSPNDDSRIEIAYAIARHLKLDGWPAAYDPLPVIDPSLMEVGK